eukprot:403352625
MLSCQSRRQFIGKPVGLSHIANVKSKFVINSTGEIGSIFVKQAPLAQKTQGVTAAFVYRQKMQA